MEIYQFGENKNIKIYQFSENKNLSTTLSQICTLKPGDVILTGTPGGVGMHRSPPKYLQERIFIFKALS